jgi:hypothetical protein
MAVSKQKRPRVLAIDLGYSSVKISFIDDNGSLVNYKMISAISELPEAPLEIDNDTVFKLNEKWYVIGPNSLKLDRNYRLKLETYEQMKAIYPVVISYFLSKYSDIKWDKVAIGLSMAFSDKADDLLKFLYESLLISPDTNFFVCLPQGLACKAAFAKYGQNVKDSNIHTTDNKLDSYVICDGGYLSIDICAVIDQKSAAGATIGIPDTGVICISRDIAEYIYKTYEYRISTKEAQTVVDSGILTRRGKVIDLSDVVDKYTRIYLANVLNLLEEKYSSQLDASNGLLIVGGLSHFFAKYLNDEQFIKEVEKHFPVSFIHVPTDYGEYYNSISYMLIAEKLMGYVEQ